MPKYNLTCSEAREMLGVEEDEEENDNESTICN